LILAAGWYTAIRYYIEILKEETQTMAETTEATRLHNAHEHLKHDSTTETPEQVQESVRLAQLAKAREVEQRKASQAEHK